MKEIIKPVKYAGTRHAVETAINQSKTRWSWNEARNKSTIEKWEEHDERNDCPRPA